jgi:hypothetical protein
MLRSRHRNEPMLCHRKTGSISARVFGLIFLGGARKRGMKASKFTDAQMAFVIKQGDEGSRSTMRSSRHSTASCAANASIQPRSCRSKTFATSWTTGVDTTTRNDRTARSGIFLRSCGQTRPGPTDSRTKGKAENSGPEWSRVG